MSTKASYLTAAGRLNADIIALADKLAVPFCGSETAKAYAAEAFAEGMKELGQRLDDFIHGRLIEAQASIGALPSGTAGLISIVSDALHDRDAIGPFEVFADETFHREEEAA